MTYYAHSLENRPQAHWHSLRAHLLAVAKRAGGFLEPLGLGELARLAGLLHDLGKYAQEFQQRIRGALIEVDHATAGALLARDRFSETPESALAARIVAQCILGHHGGQPDGNRVDERLGKTIPDCSSWRQEIQLPASLAAAKPFGSRTPFEAYVAARMVYSALVDADHLDTGHFYQPWRLWMEPPSLAELNSRLQSHLAHLTAGKTGQLNAARQSMLQRALSLAGAPNGVYTLTVPTGGGKTLASLAFGLARAVQCGLERVIVAVPYTSIIEQTADVFRAALGDDNPAKPIVLEHHSAFEARGDSAEGEEKLKAAAENWNVPIIVTTTVQLLESLYGNKPSRSRKVHNIARSVLILDEAQTLPSRLLRPSVAMLDELARTYGCTVVLCTATQPAILRQDGFVGGKEGLRDSLELAPQPDRLARALKRVTFRRAGKLAKRELARRLRNEARVLCVVGTRARSRELHSLLAGAPGAFHLSTWMCPAHRRKILAAISQALRGRAPVRLVSTSLIECGVDLDFPVAYREAAGLESIIQTAGRCNREGRRKAKDSVTWVYELDRADGRLLPEVAQRWAAARAAWRSADRRGRDLLAPETMREYCRDLYWTAGARALDAPGILDEIRRRRIDFPCAWIAAEFRLIEDDSVPVLTPYGDGPRAIAELDQGLALGDDLRKLARRAQQFAVSVKPSERETLIADGRARVVREDVYGDRFVALADPAAYGATGIVIG